MIRAPSRSVHGLPNPNVGGAVVCGQMASLCAVYKLGVAGCCRTWRSVGTLGRLSSFGTVARRRAVAGAGEATMAPLRCWSECSGVESRRTDGGARPRGCDGGSVSRFRM